MNLMDVLKAKQEFEERRGIEPTHLYLSPRKFRELTEAVGELATTSGSHIYICGLEIYPQIMPENAQEKGFYLT